MKHAYLIIAHNEFEILGKLLRVLDDERNDIYIHFDGKLKHIPALHTQRSRLHVLAKRVKVYWGDFTIVQAELALFEEAFRKGGYSYYHLLSGVDMPLKSQDYIHRFFEENKGKEFIGYYQDDVESLIDTKMRRWHLCPGSYGEPQNSGKARLRRIATGGLLRLQLLLGIRRNQSVPFRKGTQWVSVTSGFVACLLRQKEAIAHTYHHTFCADEIFVQTVCWNSTFRESLYDSSDEANGCLRMIHWENNRLIEWTEQDYDLLMNSEALFARKFSSRYPGVVDRIVNTIL